MEPHSPRSQLYSHSALGRALFFSFLSTASALAISGLAFLASKTCLGSKLSLTTVALFAIDISIPDVSASQWLHPRGHRITPFYRSHTLARHSMTRICYSVPYSTVFLIPVSYNHGYPPITSQLRILSHLYPLTLQNGNGSPLFFVLHYIFKQTLPTREMLGRWELHITLRPGMYLCFVRNRHRPQCRSTMKDWYCDPFCKSSWRSSVEDAHGWRKVALLVVHHLT